MEEPELESKEGVLELASLVRDFEKRQNKLKIEKRVQVYIGRENPIKGYERFSIIVGRWPIEKARYGIVSLVGPKRMAYRENIDLIGGLLGGLTSLWEKDGQRR